MDAKYSVDKKAISFHEVPVGCDMVCIVSVAVRIFQVKFFQKGIFSARTHPGPEVSIRPEDPKTWLELTAEAE